MATYEGSNGTVKIKSGSDTLTAVAEVRTWSVTHTRATVETTAMGDSFRSHKKGLQEWSGSMEIVYTDSENTIVETALNPDTDTAVTVELYPDNAGSTKFVGTIIITDFSATIAYDGLMTASVSFVGTGSPTVTNWKY